MFVLIKDYGSYDGSENYGVYSSLELAKEAALKANPTMEKWHKLYSSLWRSDPNIDTFGWEIEEWELDA